MHVFVTGGAGFIGSHLVEHHLAKGDQVHVVDDLSTGSLDNLHSFQGDADFRFDRADILLWPHLDKVAAWADRIYHMAAVVGMFRVLKDPIHVLATNVAGTERLLRAVRSSGWRPQVLIASSSEVYGPDGDGLLEETADLHIRSGAVVRWNYAISKLADEALALSYVRELDLHITIARLFNTVGPRQAGRYGMVVPRFVRQAVRNEPITVYGDGSQSRCFCDVRDTVRALDLLLSNPGSKGKIVNVGNDREITIGGLAELVRSWAESSSKIETIPYRQAYGEGYEDILHRLPSLARLGELTDLKHRYTLEDTVEHLVALEKEAAVPA
ncbi:MAG: NAD-dependent epimerase/dehydratase family protein [Acidobacteria bacterium]|nr:NAD-dependent epimerase/dehydratase family protein [Acidobacteriota bacterium]